MVVEQSWRTLGAEAARVVDRRLTANRIRFWSIVSATVFISGIVASWFAVPDQLPLPDFAARWSAGRFVVEGLGPALYDLGRQAAMQAAATGSTKTSWFVSPPFVAVLFTPFALLPYWMACIVWFAVSALALWLSLRLLRPWVPRVFARNWRVTTIVIWTCYPVLQVLFVGQDTTLVLLALAVGVHLLDRERDFAAGIVLALGLIKPHLVFLVPVFLLVYGRFRALFSFTAAALALVVVSLLVAGPQGFSAWLATVGSDDYASAVQQGFAWKAVSVSALLTGLAPQSVGRWWQLLATLTGLLACVPAIRALFTRRSGSVRFGWVVALATAVVASPHVMVYDLVLAIPVVLALAWTRWDALTRLTLLAMTIALWLAAPLQIALENSNWPLTALGAPWAAIGVVVLWHRLLQAGREDPTHADQAAFLDLLTGQGARPAAQSKRHLSSWRQLALLCQTPRPALASRLLRRPPRTPGGSVLSSRPPAM